MLSIDLKSAINNSATNFTTLLFQLLLKSDMENRHKLAQIYPIEVAMIHIFRNKCIYVDNNRTIADYEAIERAAIKQVEYEANYLISGLSCE
jgi:hypothetical protein